MCGRYYYDAKTTDDIENELGLEPGLIDMETGDVVPGSSPIVITGKRNSDKLQVSHMKWGFAGKDSSLIINARVESVLDKPMFAESVRHRRCIMPATLFYEWDRDRNKNSFYNKDRSTIYLAGFYDLRDNVDSFVILTTAANDSMIRVHDRMPLMIGREDVGRWLGGGEEFAGMLKMEMPLLGSHSDYEQMSLFTDM